MAYRIAKPVNTPEINFQGMNKSVEKSFDTMLKRLGCTDGTDAHIISHWQSEPAGFRLQVTRKLDGEALTKFVDGHGNIRP
jgi:hypothetical protein